MLETISVKILTIDLVILVSNTLYYTKVIIE